MAFDITICFMILVVLHFLGDFLLQNHKMATNKSSDNTVLLIHVILYSIPFSLFFGIVYGIVNGLIHFAIDYATSRMTKKLYKDNNMRGFFLVIGFDQMLHMLTLIGTFYIMFYTDFMFVHFNRVWVL